jgi:hypothetical protein
MKFIPVLLLVFLVAGAFAGEPLTVVKTYEEFAAYGLKADVIYDKNQKIMAINVEAVDPAKKLPDWMQAFYVAPRDAQTARPTYVFDMAKPNRVGAFMGWMAGKSDLVFIVGPSLREGQTFTGKQYLAISADDLIAWRGHK